MAAKREEASAVTLAEIEKRQSSRLVIILGLIAAFFFVELAGAKLSRSDVLEADAYHLLMDVFALAISLAAMRVASRTPSPRFTFGLRRAEPLAALTNGVLVLGLAIELVRDAVGHLGDTAMPRTGLMLVVAVAALVVNGLNAWLLHGAMGHHGHAHHGHAHHGHADGEEAHARHARAETEHEHAHEHDHVHEQDHDHGAHGPALHGHQLNLRGAWLHLLGDALGSVAALGAGLAIRFGAPPIIDPLASFLVVAILVVGALRLLRDAGLVLIEAAPPHLSVKTIEKALLKVEGVSQVSSLHVWSLGTGHDAIMAHVRGAPGDGTLGARACEHLMTTFTVEYVTVQVDVATP